jgi:hypothetical protein
MALDQQKETGQQQEQEQQQEGVQQQQQQQQQREEGQARGAPQQEQAEELEAAAAAGAAGGGDGSSGGSSRDPCYCCIARASGALEVYALPAMELVFSCSSLADGKALLENKQQQEQQEQHERQEGQQQEGDAMDADGLAPAAGPAPAPDVPSVTVVELQVDSFAAGSGAVPDMERPAFIACLSDGTVVAYQAFSPVDGSGSGSSSSSSSAPGPGSTSAAGRAAAHGDAAAAAAAVEAAAAPGVSLRRLRLDTSGAERALPPAAAALPYLRRLVRFDGLGPEAGRPGGVSGVFVGGPAPLLLVAGRGTLTAVPLSNEGTVAAFSPLNNANCEHGFVASCFDGG